MKRIKTGKENAMQIDVRFFAAAYLHKGKEKIDCLFCGKLNIKKIIWFETENQHLGALCLNCWRKLRRDEIK
jgi:hypothetical protein